MGVRAVPDGPLQASRSTTRAERSFSTSTGPSWDAPVFVWSVWALMLAAVYFFVAEFGSRVFYQDDWIFVPVLTGNERLTLPWLWQQNNEHRLPLTNLVILVLYHLSGFDARVGMFFTVTALGVLTLVLIRTAKLLRGWTSNADAL